MSAAMSDECTAHLPSRPWRAGRWADARIMHRHRSSATARDAVEARRILATDSCGDHPAVLVHGFAILAADASRKGGQRGDGVGTVIAHGFDAALDGAGIPPAKPLRRAPGTPPSIPDLAPAEVAQAARRILTATRHLRPEPVASVLAERIGYAVGQRTEGEERAICDAVAQPISEADRMARAWLGAERKPRRPKRLARVLSPKPGTPEAAWSREGTHFSTRNPRYHFMAYGMWTAEDGREVAFNRQYRQILQRWPGGPVEAADGDERVMPSRTRYFYNDGHHEQDKRRRSRDGLLAAGWPPESVPFERGRSIPASRLPLSWGMK